MKETTKKLATGSKLWPMILGGAVVLQCASPFLMAQNGAPAGNPPAGAVFLSADDDLKNLTKQLNLSPDQIDKAREIIAEREKHVIEVRTQFPAPKPGAAPAAGGPAKMQEVYKAAHVKMLTILDAEQQKQYDALDAQAQGPHDKQ